ncbi:jg17065 [Pararge aegeria aegeria]|uniref:Jg17065 protein n=1 Tax=Pararge aegeria aegeria TaxID=348720 RepID=A0A8S4R1S6_9NEOP|nr:jg17065 [Pararge aegeria aegeria]
MRACVLKSVQYRAVLPAPDLILSTIKFKFKIHSYQAGLNISVINNITASLFVVTLPLARKADSTEKKPARNSAVALFQHQSVDCMPVDWGVLE